MTPTRRTSACGAAIVTALVGVVALTEAQAARPSSARYVSSQAYLHVLRAGLFLEKGDEPAAVEELQLALVYDPESYHLTVWLARLTWKIGRGARVERLVERAMRLGRQRAEPWLLRGELLRSTGDARGAARAFERAALLEPGSAEAGRAAVALAELLEERGQGDRALEVLARYGRGGDPAVTAALVERQRARGDLDSAIASLDRRIARTPTATPALLARVVLLERAARRKDAAAASRELAARAPDDPQRLFSAARAHLFAGDRLASQAYAERLLGDHPARALDVARFQRDAGELELAEKTLEAALAQDAKAGAVRLELADLALERGRASRARALIGDWPPADRSFETATALIMISWVDERHPDRALEVGRRALDSRPDAIGVLTTWALIAARSGKRDLAIKMLEGALAGSKTTEEERRAVLVTAATIEAEAGSLERGDARLVEAGRRETALELAMLIARADLQQRFGSVIRAERLAQSAIDRAPAHPTALLLLARLRAARRARLGETDALVLAALAPEPDHPALVAAHGRLLLAQGRAELAARWLDRAAELDPQDPLRWEHLGDANLALRRPSAAERAYTRSLGLLQRSVAHRAPDALPRKERLERKRAKVQR
ncbi:MAG: tetratricopeptide repeat protein [Deltaproteobacteria bacterium]|nr:tetratricopeptide repeat protein [Deltaproteobacteria bacterium]